MALGGGTGGGGNARGVRAGGAFIELSAKDSISAALKRVGQRFAAFGKMVLAATGVGGIVGGLLGGLSFKETVDDLARMNDVAKAFGVNGTRISGLFGVLGTAGGEFKENLEGVIQFSGTIEKALQGIGQGAELFDGLKVTAEEIGKLPIDDQFFSVLGAIRELPQPLQEAKLALLGGSDSMKQWQRLLSMSNAEVRELAANTAFSTAELEDATKASRGLQAVGAAVLRIWQQLVILVSPFVADLADKIAAALKPVQEWLRGRTLQDLWDMAKAAFAAGLAWIDLQAQKLFVKVGSYLTGEFNKAVLAAKEAFADLGSHISKALMGALNGPATLLAGMLNGINPVAAAAIRAAMNAGRFDGQAEKDAARKEFEDKEQLRNKVTGDLLGGLDKGLLKSAVSFLAELARLDANRKNRLADPEVPVTPKVAASLARIGQVLGVLGGGGAFLRQGFGFQGSDAPARQMVKEQQKGNAKLDEVRKAVEKIGFPKFL
jgi:hypothetical protein